MGQDSAVRTGTIDVVNALAELDPTLTKERLQQSMLEGETARDGCTANDPPSTPGYIAWARTVKGLRDVLIPLGWTKNDDVNFSTAISPHKGIAIAVATGDESTGQPQLIPKTKYAKGPATLAAVEMNKLQLELFGTSPALTETGAISGPQTWMLMRRRTGDTLFSELSLPDGAGYDGRIETWAVRIILEPFILEPNPFPEDDESEDPIDIPIRRRS